MLWLCWQWVCPKKGYLPHYNCTWTRRDHRDPRALARVNQGRLSEPAIQTAGHKKSVITLDISWSISWDWIRCGCLMMIINFLGWDPFFFTCFLELWGWFSNIWWIAMVGSFLGTSSWVAIIFRMALGVYDTTCVSSARQRLRLPRISCESLAQVPHLPFIFFQSPFKK